MVYTNCYFDGAKVRRKIEITKSFDKNFRLLTIFNLYMKYNVIILLMKAKTIDNVR